MQRRSRMSFYAAGIFTTIFCALALTAFPRLSLRAQEIPKEAPKEIAQSAPQEPAKEVHGKVTDEDGVPVARVEVTAHWGVDPLISLTVYTDAVGDFQIPSISGEKVSISLSKPGYFRTDATVLELKSGVNDATFKLYHETELQQKIDVRSGPVQIDPDTTSHQETLVQHEVLNTPVPSSHDLQQSLFTMPNVLQDTNGRIHIAGARQGQTEILLDGFEINDPANGTFTPRLNVDSVQSATVETGGYGAQYAHGGAGIVVLDTQAGDDQWRFGATNFIPLISFREGTHFANWFPRTTISGPIKKGRAWFSMASTAQHSYSVVNELPEGQNTATSWAGDNLLRGQVNITPQNILQTSFLYNQSSEPQFGLGPLSPLSTTTDHKARRYFISAKDQIWLGKTLLEIGAAADSTRGINIPQGDATYVVSSSDTSGNYFQKLKQQSRRIQFVGDLNSATLKFWGTHNFSAGWNVDDLTFSQNATRSEIDFQREDGTTAEIATFSGPSLFRISNTQAGGYAQDLWRPVKHVVFSIGIRADWDRLIQDTLVQPRFAMNWVPIGDGRMKFTVAWGEHYQPVNLTLFGQGSDQQRTDTFFDATGLVQIGTPVVSSFIIPTFGLRQQRSYNTTIEFDERILKNTYIGIAYILRDGRDGLAWESESSGAFLLQNNRQDRFESGEVYLRHVFNEKAEIFVNYVRSSATSNEVLDPTVVSLFLSPQQPGRLLWDAPNRFISRGWGPLPLKKWDLLGSYFMEYHTGFPFSVVNDEEQLVGGANSLRYPTYFSLNLGVEKQFQFRKHVWAVRVSSNNITGHNNPIAVVDNIDAPDFGTFSGGHIRSFTARLRLVTSSH
jgi:hypothetical protein